MDAALKKETVKEGTQGENPNKGWRHSCLWGKGPRREMPDNYLSERKNKFNCTIDMWHSQFEVLSVSAVKCISGTKCTIKTEL